jgi:riboflavin transporter FmnP
VNKEELSLLTDEQLLLEAKRLKSSSIIKALLIGFLVGVIIWSVVKGNLSLFTLIPIYFIYMLVRAAKRDTHLKEVLKERNLKI